MNTVCDKEKKEEFKNKFKEVLNNNLGNFHQSKIDMFNKFFNLKPCLIFLGLLFVIHTFFYFYYDSNILIIKQFLCISIPIALLYITILFVEININYIKKVKKIIFPQLLSVFGDNIRYYYNGIMTDTVIKKITTAEYNSTKLFKYIVNRHCIDDSIAGEYKGVKFLIAETSLDHEPIKKETELKHFLFKGVAMRFEINKTINNQVLILNKFANHYIPKDFEMVTLESSEFSKKYNVYAKRLKTDPTRGQIEARYILTPAFMDRFMSLQTSFRVNKISCSINKNKLFILLSTRRNLFEINNWFKKINDVNQYKHLYNEFVSVLSFIDVLNLFSKTKL